MNHVWIKFLSILIFHSCILQSQMHANTDSLKMNVYFISGLGADKRLFSKLTIDSVFAVHHIEWERPDRRESIRHYATRLISQIDTSQPFQLVGLSFGGLIAQEMAQIINPAHIILISTLSTGRPLSKFNRFLVNALLASPLILDLGKNPIRFTNNLFGAHTVEEKQLLKAVLKDTDNRFIRWAARQLISWNQNTRVPSSLQIHGSDDRIIRFGWVQPDIVIQGGEHLMVYSKAQEISGILNRELQKYYITSK